MNEKVAAFDLEIAFNVSRIPLTQFQPAPGEDCEVILDDAWVSARYPKEGDGLIWKDDIIWRPLPATADFKRFRPLGITCAAITTTHGTWTYAARDVVDGGYAERMTAGQCQDLLDDIQTLIAGGYTVITWNGLGFDFDILGQEANASALCAKIAISEDHVDMMYHFFCAKGFAVGLDAVSKGLGLDGKPEGIDGAKAPELWPTDPERVLAYVESDAQQTLDVYQRSHYGYEDDIELSWAARSGRLTTWRADKWLSVPEANALALPDTSWMDAPWTREKFYGWATAAEMPFGIIGESQDEGFDYNMTRSLSEQK